MGGPHRQRNKFEIPLTFSDQAQLRRAKELAEERQATKTRVMAAERKSPCVRVGNVSITEWPDGKIWLAHRNGEGLRTDAEKLGKVLEEYFEKEF